MKPMPSSWPPSKFRRRIIRRIALSKWICKQWWEIRLEQQEVDFIMTIEIQTRNSQLSRTMATSRTSSSEATTSITSRTSTKINITSRCWYRVRRDPCNIQMATTATGATSSTCSRSWPTSTPKTSESYNHHRYTHSTARAPQGKNRLMEITATSRWPEVMITNFICRSQEWDSRVKTSWLRVKIIKCLIIMNRIHRFIWKSLLWLPATSIEHHRSSRVHRPTRRTKAALSNRDRFKMLDKASIIITT